MPETTNDDLETGDDLTITKTTRQGAGTWVCGRLNGHRFDALVFPQHAENPEYELGESQISKLFLRRLADKTEVANFDRGWDVRPTTDEASATFYVATLARLSSSTRRTKPKPGRLPSRRSQNFRPSADQPAPSTFERSGRRPTTRSNWRSGTAR